MITLEDDSLVFRFPQVHEDARCSIGFQRTLRIPDDDRDYPLPPGLGGVLCVTWTTTRGVFRRDGDAAAAC